MLDTFILNHIDGFAQAMAILLLIVIGTPFISFKGGIPRLGGTILGKNKGIIVFIILGFATYLIFEPGLKWIVSKLIELFVEFTISILIILFGLAILEWNSKMRWDYKWYGVVPLILGIILFIIEIV